MAQALREPGRPRVAICETQPVTAAGLKSVLKECEDLEWVETVETLEAAVEAVWRHRPNLLVVDKAMGLESVLERLEDLRGPEAQTAVVVWGMSVSQMEALRLLQGGVKGIIRKGAKLELLLACLRSAVAGVPWMEDCIFRERPPADKPSHSDLTPREQQVMDLIEQGFKNKEIAQELGIRPGTVKIHLKHIFEKTGVRGRYGLALTGMKDRGMLALM